MRHFLPPLLAILVLACAVPALAGPVSPELAAVLQDAAPDAEIPVLVTLAGKVDLRPYKGMRKQLRRGLVRALRKKADLEQPVLVAGLRAAGGKRIRSLWSINGIAARIPAWLVAELAADPAVERIRLDAVVEAPAVPYGSSAPPEWNVAAVAAPDLWALGYTGAGVVVANMDSGVDYRHPDLANNWRGGNNSWYDPNGQHTVPTDLLGHGTQAMGLMAGGSAGGSAIGVAPGAQWIAVKIFDDSGRTTLSNIHLGFQWLLDPDGDPATDDAPDIVSNSWSLQGGVDLCDLEFNSDIQVLKAAGIAVVFSAGNYGPGSLTSVSPANNPASFSVGALDAAQNAADFSSRGPSACDGGTFPHLMAPGVDVRSSDLSLNGMPLYAQVSGTSYSAPQVAGVMALLAEAFPDAGVADLEAALVQSARDLGPAGPDNQYGHGLVDARAAFIALETAVPPPPPPVNQAPSAAADRYDALAGVPLVVGAPGVLGNDGDPDGAPLTAILLSPPRHGTLRLAGNGGFIYRARPRYQGEDHFTYQVSDGEFAATATVTLDVAPRARQNRPPQARFDKAGTRRGKAVAIPVLANDRAPDGRLDPASVVIARPPGRGGQAVANGDGTITYTPAAGFAGLETFSYTVADDTGAVSRPAIVAIRTKR